MVWRYWLRRFGLGWRLKIHEFVLVFGWISLGGICHPHYLDAKEEGHWCHQLRVAHQINGMALAEARILKLRRISPRHPRALNFTGDIQAREFAYLTATDRKTILEILAEPSSKIEQVRASRISNLPENLLESLSLQEIKD